MLTHIFKRFCCKDASDFKTMPFLLLLFELLSPKRCHLCCYRKHACVLTWSGVIMYVQGVGSYLILSTMLKKSK